MTCLSETTTTQRGTWSNLREHNAIASAMPSAMREDYRLTVMTRPCGFTEIGLYQIATGKLMAVVSRPEYGCNWFLHYAGVSFPRERFKSRKAVLERMFSLVTTHEG